MKPVVSLTIPCYNEGKFIFKAVKELEKVLDSTKYSYEIILFDDKSKDNTAENIRKIAASDKKARAFFHKENQGRGQTVKDAIEESKGSIVGYIDIDLEIPAHYVPAMVKAIEEGYDVAIAERIDKLSLKHLHRHLLSKGYQAIVKTSLKITIKDTEAGCKFFNKKTMMHLIRKTENRHWFWDTEIMALAFYEGKRIKEIPVVFQKNPESKSTVKVFSDTKKYLKEVRHFRKRMKKEGKL